MVSLKQTTKIVELEGLLYFSDIEFSSSNVSILLQHLRTIDKQLELEFVEYSSAAAFRPILKKLLESMAKKDSIANFKKFFTMCYEFCTTFSEVFEILQIRSVLQVPADSGKNCL